MYLLVLCITAGEHAMADPFLSLNSYYSSQTGKKVFKNDRDFVMHYTEPKKGTYTIIFPFQVTFQIVRSL